MEARTAKAVADLFDELSMVPGPSKRAVRRARRLGWVPPLAWDDDIDDPAAVPTVGERDRGMDVGEFEFLVRSGVRPDLAAVRLGRTWGSVVTAYLRAGGSVPWCRFGHVRPVGAGPVCADCSAQAVA